MITLEQLVAASTGDLRLAPGQGRTPSPAATAAITGVHVSELDDPTPYLEGGELLLTTGMPLLRAGADANGYVERLASRGVAALGLGLGPWARAVPASIREACSLHGLALVLVPDGVPFQNVSRAYWGLALRDDTAGLRHVLGVQAQLVRTATRTDAVSALVRSVAQSLGGWAAYVPAAELAAGGTDVTVWPPPSLPSALTLRGDLARLGRSGTPAAGTFEVNGQAVVAHPIAGAGRAHGFLVVGAGRTLAGADRDLIATACTLLSLRVRQREAVAGAAAQLGSAAVLLLQSGLGEAARLVADDAGLGPLPERVRWVCLQTVEEQDAAAALATSTRLRFSAGSVPALQPCPYRLDDEGLVWVLTPASAWAEAPEGPAASAEDPGTGAPTQPRGVEHSVPPGGAVGETQALGAPPAGLREAALAAAAGVLAPLTAPEASPAAHWVRELEGFERADLLGTVREYLRHRGHWEDVSRALGVHRNTVRHRMALATELLGVDLDHPDVSAHLWLALRSH